MKRKKTEEKKKTREIFNTQQRAVSARLFRTPIQVFGRF
jgi:hypothetical protein